MNRINSRKAAQRERRKDTAIGMGFILAGVLLFVLQFMIWYLAMWGAWAIIVPGLGDFGLCALGCSVLDAVAEEDAPLWKEKRYLDSEDF